MTTDLLIIDPQNDFVHRDGALSVPDGERDMDRLADFIREKRNRIDQIWVSLDTHNMYHISHPMWFKDKNGRHPDPFTIITVSELGDKWWTTNPDEHKWTLWYLQELELLGRYPHCIWPYHCLIGSEGHNVYKPLLSALNEWEYDNRKSVQYVYKGQDPCLEHFGMFAPEVNTEDYDLGLFVERFTKSDQILVAGEASSHCVAFSVRQATELILRPEDCEKVTLLVDTMSAVPGFEDAEKKFFEDMGKLSVKSSTTGSLDL